MTKKLAAKLLSQESVVAHNGEQFNKRDFNWVALWYSSGGSRNNDCT